MLFFQLSKIKQTNLCCLEKKGGGVLSKSFESKEWEKNWIVFIEKKKDGK